MLVVFTAALHAGWHILFYRRGHKLKEFLSLAELPVHVRIIMNSYE